MKIDHVTYISPSNKVVSNKSVNGFVTDKGTDYTVVSKGNDLIKLPFIDGLLVNQKVSIGIYDIPDRANMVKIQITVPNVASISDTVYQFLVTRDSIYPRSINDIVDVVDDNFKETSYRLLGISSSGDLVNINLELSNEGIDRAFLSWNNIYVKINERLYSILGEENNLYNILSSGEKAVNLVITQDFNLKASVDNFLEIINKELPSEVIQKVILNLSTIESAAYRWSFLSIFQQFSKARVQLRESRSSSCKTFRLIFELEDNDGDLILVDCLYVLDNNSLNIVVRSQILLSNDDKNKFSTIFNKLLNETGLCCSISFVVQSRQVMDKILTRSDCESYTYRV